jgi:hypothetical protein
MSETDARDPKRPSETLSDADIVSERLVRRRSFLSRTGLLVGGALAAAVGMRAARADDPDKDGDDPQKPTDPDKPGDPDKTTDPDKRRKRKPRPTDPDKPADPDAKRSPDPDARKRRQSDPDKAPDQD